MSEKRRENEDPRDTLGGAPATPGSRDDKAREKCRTDRESLSPRETADCAGNDLAEHYENEEDGGS